MNVMDATSAGDAFIHLAHYVMTTGQIVQSRQGVKVRELTGVTVEILNPLQRVICLPHRNNNIFATVAETLWVLGGRNDMAFLSHYLPRAVDYSDDGKTWRGGYGPRLRNWNGIDQIEEIIVLLKEDPLSRRAVISLFDPNTDFENSKDIPCNNWLQFLIRDGKLHMHVTQRSCDILWGFSGINTFEWSVLQECISKILGVDVGPVKWFIGSAHIYENVWERLDSIIRYSSYFQNMYSLLINTVRMKINTLAHLDNDLEMFFENEAVIRNHEWNNEDIIHKISNDFIREALWMMMIYNNQKDFDLVSNILNKEMIDADLKTAVKEYLTRKGNTGIYRLRSSYDNLFLGQFKNE
jgi:thymidylate synthase